jgi:hypothetical protein
MNNLLNRILSLVKSRKTFRGYFKRHLGSDAFHFWKEVGSNRDYIEQVRFLRQIPEIKEKCKDEDFLFWIIEGCKAESDNDKRFNEEAKKQAKKMEIERILEERAEQSANKMA